MAESLIAVSQSKPNQFIMTVCKAAQIVQAPIIIQRIRGDDKKDAATLYSG